MTANGRSIGENCRGRRSELPDVIRPIGEPLMARAGFGVLRGNLFDSAIIKTSVIGPEFRQRYLSNPDDPEAFECTAVVFEGPEDYHARIDDPALAIDESSMLVIRGAGPIGYPGAAEVVNMRPPAYLIERGITALPCMGDGRQSGTSGSPSILNARPRPPSAAISRCSPPVTGCVWTCGRGRVDVLLDDAELARRRAASRLGVGLATPPRRPLAGVATRETVGQLGEGAVLELAVEYQRIVANRGAPRDNH
jgi:dihydroxy-acid dehydratase